ncbi:MAG: hypothetical protein AABW68_01080 [archaeon]
MRRALVLTLFLLLAATTGVWGHEGEEEAIDSSIQLAQTLRENSYNVILLTSAALIVLVVYSIKTKPRKEKMKRILFWTIAFFAVGSNLYLAGATIYTNMVSPTGGPVHWHTDYEVWNCGQPLDLIDPTGWDNRVGTWEVHEHNDNRMHIEGTILNMDQASFHHFFEITGGTIEQEGMTYPSVNGDVTLPATGSCNERPAELQVFRLYVTNPESQKNWTYTQEKLEYPEGLEKIMAPYSNVPPGDCLIIEYDAPKEKTTHSCASYRAAMDRGELHGR